MPLENSEYNFEKSCLRKFFFKSKISLQYLVLKSIREVDLKLMNIDCRIRVYFNSKDLLNLR